MACLDWIWRAAAAAAGKCVRLQVPTRCSGGLKHAVHHLWGREAEGLKCVCAVLTELQAKMRGG